MTERETSGAQSRSDGGGSAAACRFSSVLQSVSLQVLVDGLGFSAPARQSRISRPSLLALILSLHHKIYFVWFL